MTVVLFLVLGVLAGAYLCWWGLYQPEEDE